MIALAITGGVLIILLVFIVITYNKFVRYSTMVEEAFSTMDVYLRKRWDLIPNLVNVVKGYAAYEKDTLSQIINLRNMNYNNMNLNDKVDAENRISAGISKIFGIAESYPALKADGNFNMLMNQLASIENDIVNGRKYYNGAVKQYNILVESFPSNIIASIFNYKKMQMFQTEEQTRANVEVKF